MSKPVPYEFDESKRRDPLEASDPDNLPYSISETEIESLLMRARKTASCVFIACDEAPAKEISNIIRELIGCILILERNLPKSVQTVRTIVHNKFDDPPDWRPNTEK